MIIYKITHIATGKIYIGKHNRSIPDRRFQAHYRADNLLGRCMRKYGIEAFKVEIVDYGENDSQLFDLERQWIIKLNCIHPNGFNFNAGGQGKSGHKYNEASRRNFSMAQRGNKNSRILTPEQVKEIRASTEQYDFLAIRFKVSAGTIRRCRDRVHYTEIS